MMALDQLLYRYYRHTKGDHQLAGYARIYLGRFFEFLASANMIVWGLVLLLPLFVLVRLYQASSSWFSTPCLPINFLSFFGIFHTSNFPLIKKMYHYIPLISISLF